MTTDLEDQARALYDAVAADYPSPMPWNLERLGFLIRHGVETDEDATCCHCGAPQPVIGRTACEPCLEARGLTFETGGRLW